jgi:hypothetical protein
MPATAEALEALLEKGDSQGIVELFAQAGEKERGRLAPLVRDRLSGHVNSIAPLPEFARVLLQSPMVAQYMGFKTSSAQIRQFAAARLAMFATGNLADLKKLSLPPGDDGQRAIDIIIARRPKWLEKWALQLLHPRGRFSVGINHFPLVRGLVRAGLIAEPDDPAYIQSMIGGLLPNPLAGLRDDPALLDNAIWRLFEPDAPVQANLVLADSWGEALVQLSKEGLLARDRLLESTLSVLETDIKADRARWYLKLHERLEPTQQELGARLDRYAGILHSRIPQIVGCALDVLESLAKVERIPVQTLTQGLMAALHVKEKRKAKAALRLLSVIAENDRPGHATAARTTAARTAAAALGHEAAEVQTAGWRIVERYGAPNDPDLVSQVDSHADFVCAALQEGVREWLKVAGREQATPEAPLPDLDELSRRAVAIDPIYRRLARVNEVLAALEKGIVDFAPLRSDGADIPRLTAEQGIRPIADMDELLDLLGRLIERVDDADDFERALDGLSRLCDQRPDDFEARTAPLEARIQSLTSDDHPVYVPGVLHHHIYDLVHQWRRPIERSAKKILLVTAQRSGDLPLAETLGPHEEGVSSAVLYRFLQARVREIAERVSAGLAAPLLAAPTHRGGWIDPRALVARLAVYRAQGMPVGELDGVSALLRLAPDHRAEALARTRRLLPATEPIPRFVEQFTQALRYALGDETTSIGQTPSLWIAAARARSPFADDPRLDAVHPNLGPNAACVATLRVTPPENPAHRYTPLQWHVSPALPHVLPISHPTMLMCQAEGYTLGLSGLGADIPWLFSLRPIAPEEVFLKGCASLMDSSEGVIIDSERRQFLLPLLHADVPLGPHATTLLALGLTAKDGSVSGLAVDVLLASIEDGRFDPERLGNGMARALAQGVGKYARYARTLGSVARTSSLHAEAVRQSIEHALQGDPNRVVVREVGRLVELAHELCQKCGQGVTREAARTFLGRLPAGGKTAQLIGQLLAIGEKIDPRRSRELQAKVVEHRLARAERWSNAAPLTSP